MLQCNRPEESDAKAEGVLLTQCLRNERVPRPLYITMNYISTTLVSLWAKLGMAPGETGLEKMAVAMLVIVLFLAYIPFSQEQRSTCGDAINSSLAVGDELMDSDFVYTSEMVDNGELSYVVRPF